MHTPLFKLALPPARSPALCALRPGSLGDIARFYLSEWFDE